MSSSDEYLLVVIYENYPLRKELVYSIKSKCVWYDLEVLFKLGLKTYTLERIEEFKRIESYWVKKESKTRRIVLLIVKCFNRFNCFRCNWEHFKKLFQGMLNEDGYAIVAEKCEQDKDTKPNKEIWVFKIIKGKNIAKIIIELDKKDRKFKEAIIKDMSYYEVKGLELEFVTTCKAFVGRKIKELPDIDWDFLFQNCVNCKSPYPCKLLK